MIAELRANKPILTKEEKAALNGPLEPRPGDYDSKGKNTVQQGNNQQKVIKR